MLVAQICYLLHFTPIRPNQNLTSNVVTQHESDFVKGKKWKSNRFITLCKKWKQDICVSCFFISRADSPSHVNNGTYNSLFIMQSGDKFDLSVRSVHACRSPKPLQCSCRGMCREASQSWKQGLVALGGSLTNVLLHTLTHTDTHMHTESPSTTLEATVILGVALLLRMNR